MKTLTLLLSIVLCCPLALFGQSAAVLLKKVAEALASGNDEYAVSLFRQSAVADAEQTEMFYWTHVNKNAAVTPRLAQELAVRYKKIRNYDKAYLFYREVLQAHPQDVPTLVSCAEVQLMRGESDDAKRIYEQVMTLDPENLQANIFLGNYFYLQAERARNKLNEDYRKIASPTRMQYARYRNSLSDIFSNSYSKARTYLQKVLQLFPSTEAGKTLEKIKSIELEMNR